MTKKILKYLESLSYIKVVLNIVLTILAAIVIIELIFFITTEKNIDEQLRSLVLFSTFYSLIITLRSKVE